MIVLMAAFAGPGCGTMANHMDYAGKNRKAVPYGGVLFDAKAVGNAFETPRQIAGEKRGTISQDPTIIVLFFFDFPFTLVCDTVMLPWDVVETLTQ
jgi:uncharacterized protein YceK